MKNKANLTPAQLTVQTIENLLERVDLNATAIVNELTSLLENSPDPQGVFDLWDKESLATLLAVKKIASGLEELGANIIKLREDFALPEIEGGKPTGRLLFNPKSQPEELEPDYKSLEDG